MLLIAHQSGLFQIVGDRSMPEMRGRASALAKMSNRYKLPVVAPASVPQGLNGPMISEIHKTSRTCIFPVYQLLIEGRRKATEAIKKYEMLDSQR
jgi:hypothetical protein